MLGGMLQRIRPEGSSLFFLNLCFCINNKQILLIIENFHFCVPLLPFVF